MKIRKIKNRLHKRRMIIWFMVFIVHKADGSTAESPWSAKGYIKHFSVVFDAPETGSTFVLPERRLGLSSDRWRMEFGWHAGNRIDLNLAYDIILRIQDPALFEAGSDFGFRNPQRYRYADLSDYLVKPHSGESVGFLQNLDRISAAFHLGAADLFIGRQAIAWGSGRVINPTDVIAPFTFSSLDTEDRLGVDAIRVRIPAGWMGEVDAGFLSGKPGARTNAAYIRSRYYLWHTDIVVLFMQFRGHALIGGDFARSIGGAGTWLEAAWVRPDAFCNPARESNPSYWRLTAGADYSFANGIVGFLEYHFNGPGGNHPDEYLQGVAQTAYQQGTVYLLAKHYGMSGAQVQISPLWSMECQMILNLNDRSLIIAPQMRFSLAQNADLSIGFFRGAGRISYREDHVLSPGSEFGSYPEFAFFSFQFFY
jgi:hypothetical protein